VDPGPGSASAPELTTPSVVRRSIEVAAPADRVWQLVSDLPGMGSFSPENRGGRWVQGSGPSVGSVFVGSNGRGARRWSTRCTVTRSEPGRSFAFDVASVGMPVARWSYELEPGGSGCRLSETWEDRRGGLMRRLGVLVTGVSDRAAFTATSIEHTLAQVKSAAEADPRL
jgi:hypothetical protein